MIGIVAAAVLGLAVLSLVSLRVAARHSERRSVRNYERALGALGKTSRRSDSGLVPTRAPGAGAPAHVRTGRSDLPPPRRPAADGHVELRPGVQLRPSRAPAPAGRQDEARTGVVRPARPLRAASRSHGAEAPEPDTAQPVVAEAAGGGEQEPERTQLIVGIGRQAAAQPAGLDELVARSRLARLGRRAAPSPERNGARSLRGRAALSRASALRTDIPTDVPTDVPTDIPDIPGDLDSDGATDDPARIDPGARHPGGNGWLDGPVGASALAGPQSHAPAGETGAPPRPTRPGSEWLPGDLESAEDHDEEPGAGWVGASGLEDPEDPDLVPVVFDFDELAEPPIPPTAVRPPRAVRLPGERREALRVVSGAAAAVTVAALGAGVWILATRTGPKSTPAAGSGLGAAATTGHRAGSSSTGGDAKRTAKPATTRATPTTAVSNVVQPVSTSPTLVVYRAPAGGYSLRFAASSGACWVGAHNGTVWTWQATVGPATPATFATSGTQTIRIGAPSVLSITLGGKPVVLPKQVTPYDVEFSPTA